MNFRTSYVTWLTSNGRMDGKRANNRDLTMDDINRAEASDEDRLLQHLLTTIESHQNRVGSFQPTFPLQEATSLSDQIVR